MPPTARHTVLLVDDHDLTRSALRLMLSGEQYEVVGEASAGRAGLEAAKRLRPDVVCLDIQLPDVSGLDVLREMRDALPHTAVLMVTVSNDRDTIQSAISRGAAGFILKPFTIATVETSMKKAVASLPRSRSPA